MAIDCEKLSPNAQKIFEKLKPHFPPDPWKNPRWQEVGTVQDNGLFDLRKSVDRDKLLEKTRYTIGSFVEVVAGVYENKNGSLEGFESDHIGEMVKKKVELLFILRDLDFQIETGDICDM